MSWKLEFSEKSIKQLNKLDKYTKTLIFNWLDKNIDNCLDPRFTGKSLKGNLSGLWRYRIGDYRVICKLDDGKCIVITLNIGHRRDIYK